MFSVTAHCKYQLKSTPPRQLWELNMACSSEDKRASHSSCVAGSTNVATIHYIGRRCWAAGNEEKSSPLQKDSSALSCTTFSSSNLPVKPFFSDMHFALSYDLVITQNYFPFAHAKLLHTFKTNPAIHSSPFTLSSSPCICIHLTLT